MNLMNNLTDRQSEGKDGYQHCHNMLHGVLGKDTA